MKRMYMVFLRGISINVFGRIGASLVTSTLIIFLILELSRFLGALTNAYLGLLTYLIFPTLFVLGLLLILFGWHRHAKLTGKSLKTILTERFNEEDIIAGSLGSRLVKTVGLLTLINLVILAGVSGRALHFMDSASFCGTACHSVMNPEWTTYRQSPHARVRCVECHVGEGAGALIDAKLNGAWQIISLSFNLYERPIPTPVHNLRPARETCEKCHWPRMFLGNRIRSIIHYDCDRASSPSYTTLMMKIGSGEEGLERGSHWHVSERNEVRYASIDDMRERMIWVDVRQSDGSFKRYHNRRLQNYSHDRTENVHIVDCVDCHNRATHIYESPEHAVDERIRKGLIDRSLIFIKDRSLGALLNNYPDQEIAMKSIDTHIRNYYRKNYPELLSTEAGQIDTAIAVVQDIYRRNIHHRMNITWGSYPDHLGHRNNRGCFRCHNPNLIDDAGNSISMDCTLCHSILAINEDDPFKYLFDIPSDSLTGSSHEIHRYLQEEFEEVIKK
ncbi:NapC/NirT family cytochrome c [bacterium]|nr:NapC/NirT family cytochrome c [bacterium]